MYTLNVGRHSIKNMAVHPRRFWASGQYLLSPWKYQIFPNIVFFSFLLWLTSIPLYPGRSRNNARVEEKVIPNKQIRLKVSITEQCEIAAPYCEINWGRSSETEGSRNNLHFGKRNLALLQGVISALIRKNQVKKSTICLRYDVLTAVKILQCLSCYEELFSKSQGRKLMK
jgi:hypothetical protein